MSRIETIDASDFWSELPYILEEAEALEDAAGAEILIKFLEGYRATWHSIVPTMRLSAARRALAERALAVLAERPTDDGIPTR